MTEHIWIASYPRSGNTYARIAIEAMYGVGTYSPYDEHGEVLGNRQTGAEPRYRFVKTHAQNAAHDFRKKALYIVRDGRDALVSHAHYWKQTTGDERPFDEILHRLIMAKVPSRDVEDYWYCWALHVRAWMATRPGKTAVIRFEDLIQSPREKIAEAMQFLGIELQDTGAAIPSFDELRALDPQFFRRGVVGSYRDEMSKDNEAAFWEFHSGGMQLIGYGKETVAA